MTNIYWEHHQGFMCLINPLGSQSLLQTLQVRSARQKLPAIILMSLKTYGYEQQEKGSMSEPAPVLLAFFTGQVIQAPMILRILRWTPGISGWQQPTVFLSSTEIARISGGKREDLI